MRTTTLVVLGALALLAATAPARAQTYGIGTNPQGSLAYSTGAAVARVGSEDAGLLMRVVPQGGPTVTIPLLNAGEIQFSIANIVEGAFAARGEATFKGKPQRNLRLAAVLFPLRVGFFVKADGPIKSIADLKGRRVPTEFTRQKINDVFARALLATAGLSYADIQPVPVPDGVRGVDDFIAGKADTANFSVGSGKVSQANASTGGVRFLSIPEGREAEAAMQKISPGSYADLLAPKPAYVGVVQPTRVLAAPFVLLTSATTPDDAVYRLVKALHGGKAKLVTSLKAFADFDPGTMSRDLGVPYHPGAQRFFKEAGL